MLSVQHNLLAGNASRQLKVSTNRGAKITEKLSSGYQINRAADDAAGLAISEKLRRQIRGLIQGTANAKDGISYVQVADGAMNEAHSILQRMNELSIHSLNGTLTETDRAALNAEFDQLRTEIDRINQETEFNELKVFEEHEDSYYQIAGSIRWDDNQLHTVPALANTLTINLPDHYVPSEYTISVPAGVYTTQELVDEIDDALTAMTPPNPGFVFELTPEGYCNLNFESESGMPTDIDSVEGPLSYLLHDLYGGSASGDLVGTTVFGAGEKLTISSGNNDELGFYIENANGTEYISMKIPAGKYTRSELIKIINDNLAKNPKAAGVVAKEYGDSNVQITGGTGVNITGLKGNMFKYESTKPIYSSIFYDNVQYGYSTGGTSATIRGGAYYYSSTTTAKIQITSGVNDTLRFTLNGDSNYKQIQITAGEYTIRELATELNKQFKAGGIEAEITASYSSSSSKDYLILSSLVQGSGSRLAFDTTSGSVYANTYDSLFRITNYLPVSTQGKDAYLIGAATLSGAITLPQDASLSFDAGGTTCTISNIGGSYTNLDSLVSKLNQCIQNDYPDLAIEFVKSSNSLQIKAKTNDIDKFTFDSAKNQQNDTYKQLFTRTYESVNTFSCPSTSGRIEDIEQGSTGTIETPATITVTIPADKRSGSIIVDQNSRTLTFQDNVNGTGSITIEAKTYTNIQALVNEINKELAKNAKLKNITASYDSGTGKLTFTSPPLANSYNMNLTSYTSTSSVWKNIFGTYTSTIGPTRQNAGKSTYTTYNAIDASTTIGSTNDTLTLSIGGVSGTIKITQGAYTSREALKNAVQNAINGNTDLAAQQITVGITADNKLQFSRDGGTFTASGSFYDKVLISKVSGAVSHTPTGTYSSGAFTKAFIIGRKDLTGEPVEIISGANDVLTFDFNAAGNITQMDITIPEGIYDGNQIAAILQDEIQKKFDDEGLTDFDIKVTIGGINTGVANSNDDTALQIVVNSKAGAELKGGYYILDGVRGSAASFIFYKTTTTPQSTYITGTKDLSKGITFEPRKNVLTLSADSTPYQYTFPENTYYTAEGFVDLLNDMFTNGDDNGNAAPLTASIENGVLKITHKIMGSHTITDVGGSARSNIFFEESGRDFCKPLTIMVGAEAGGNIIEIPRTSVGSCSLGINSITISRPKYAEKAVERIKEAITRLSSRRSTYGAMQNRLEHTVNNNENIVENTQAAESLIRDADIAKKMVEFSINNILQQAGTSMLAQANQSRQLILSLLG